jgi:hypothetical protein
VETLSHRSPKSERKAQRFGGRKTGWPLKGRGPRDFQCVPIKEYLNILDPSSGPVVDPSEELLHIGPNLVLRDAELGGEF